MTGTVVVFAPDSLYASDLQDAFETYDLTPPTIECLGQVPNKVRPQMYDNVFTLEFPGKGDAAMALQLKPQNDSGTLRFWDTPTAERAGRIKKDASGKWALGKRYQEPEPLE